ncbi:MAG: prepilin peptidase [Candidatus Paceibacterota bacterium]
MFVLLFACGAIVASFVGVVVARLNTGHSFVRGRSRCDACDTTLPSHALVPIVSYLLGGGKARCCGARISHYAPLTELLLGALFVMAYAKLGLVPLLPLMLVALALLLALVLYDLAHQILPPVLLYSFVVVAFLFRYLSAASQGDLQAALVAAALVGLLFLAMHVFSQGRAMGFADAPLALALALLVGPELAFAGVCFSFWIGALVGITILLRRPRGSRMGVEVPFAPFLAAGFLLAYYVIPWNPLYLLIAP